MSPPPLTGMCRAFLGPSAAGNLSGGRLAGRFHRPKCVTPPPTPPPPAFSLAAKCLFIIICFHPLMARRRDVSRVPLLSLRILFPSSLPLSFPPSLLPSVPSAQPLLRLLSWRREKGFGDPQQPQSHSRRMRRLLSLPPIPPPFPSSNDVFSRGWNEPNFTPPPVFFPHFLSQPCLCVF